MPEGEEQPALRLMMRAETSIKTGQLKEGSIGAFTVMCDEPASIGGTGTAPSPLQYFFLSIGFCMLTQVHRNADAMGIEMAGATAKVTGRLGRTGSIEDGTASNGVTGVEIEVDIDTSADPDTVRELVRRSEAMCYVAQTVRNPVDTVLSASVKGQKLD